MKSNLPVLIGFLSLGSVVAVPVLNPANGHYYDIVTKPISWVDARAEAEGTIHLGQAGHLVTITSQAENDFIVQQFPQVTLGLQSGGYMLGGYQADTSGGSADGWAWVTGEAFSFTSWHPSEPNDYLGTPENYLAIHDYIGANPQGRWNDLGNFSNGYLIEFDIASVPEAGSTLALLGISLAGLGFAFRCRATARA